MTGIISWKAPFISVNFNDDRYPLNYSSSNSPQAKDHYNIQKEKTPVNVFLLYYQETLKEWNPSNIK